MKLPGGGCTDGQNAYDTGPFARSSGAIAKHEAPYVGPSITGTCIAMIAFVS